ncbi:MAG TPA: hypothetical protein VNU75_09485 [Acidimicrobiales bacterium]|nr:hypothetical protein [Acidimicrobiales bacterium]
MPEPAGDEGRAWRTIDELAALVGAYCWLEQRIFEVTGAWATAPGAVDEVAELRVWTAAASRRHGVLAGRWAERLPVRAGVEAAALVAAPAGPRGLAEAFEELEATKEPMVGVCALVETVLPWVGGVYESHLEIATPVSEASVKAVLVEARREGSAEIHSGRSLLGRLSEAGKPSGHLGDPFKRAFAPERVSPAVRPG